MSRVKADMIKIKIVAVGTLKEKYLVSMLKEYLLRLSKYCEIEIIEVKEINDTLPSAKNIEGMQLLKRIDKNAYIIALTLKEKEYTSEELATHLDKLIASGHSKLTFVIGGSLGLSNDVIQRANECLTLSKLTFTHQMSRVILLEQIYRSFKIIHHEKYHK